MRVSPTTGRILVLGALAGVAALPATAASASRYDDLDAPPSILQERFASSADTATGRTAVAAPPAMTDPATLPGLSEIAALIGDPLQGTRQPADALGLGLTEYCGPLSRTHRSDSLSGQACVERDGESTWGRVYFRNTSRRPLLVALNLIRSDGRVVEMECTHDPATERDFCETPKIRATDVPAGDLTYEAVAEMLAGDGADGIVRMTSGATRS